MNRVDEGMKWSWHMSSEANFPLTTEIDISVSKLLSFETFAKSLRVSVLVSENLVSEKKSRFRFRETLVSEKSLGFEKFGLKKEKI